MAGIQHERRAQKQRERERRMERVGYVTVRRAASLLGMSYSTVYGMILRGDLTAERVGRRRWVRLAAVRTRAEADKPSRE